MEKSGAIDPYKALIARDGAATVSCGTTHWVNLEGGGFTVKFEVSLTCDQDTETVQKAGELAFQTALEMTSTGIKLMEGK